MMKLKHLSALSLMTCILTGCSAQPAPEPAPVVTIVPDETEAPAMVQDVDDPVWISGEIRDYFASLGDSEHGSDISTGPEDGTGMPYVRMLRYTVSEIDLRQYLEETLVAHFEQPFGDVVQSQSEIREIPDFGEQEAVIQDFTLCYAGETVFVSFACVREDSDILSFCILTDEDHPLDAEALVRDAALDQ